ncbi:hypothetical protein BC835DRAFT_651975 [Cytidiella melzeri]|nr:hypothetical protein BC835DRAFT_651975 [Cytidiella melzeri]
MTGAEPSTAGSSQSASLTSEPAVPTEPHAAGGGLEGGASTSAEHDSAPSPSSTSDTSQIRAATTSRAGHDGTSATHLAMSETARQSDPSIGTSQPSISLTGHDEMKREEDKGSWKAATLAIPVKPRSRRKSSKGASRGKGTVPTATEKPPSVASTSEGKQPAKRQKITLFERITFICTPCIHRTHDVDIEEGPSKPAGTGKQELTTKELETTEHSTREPSSATTSKRSSLLILYPGLTSTSSRGSTSGSRPHKYSAAANHSGRRYRHRCSSYSNEATFATLRDRRVDVRCCAASRFYRGRDEA